MAVWVLDVDGTIVDSLTGTSLRPGSAELLASLREVGVRTILWSAGGADYALAASHRARHRVPRGRVPRQGRTGRLRPLPHRPLPAVDP